MASGRQSGSRVLHLLAAVAFAGLLYVVNREPGWAELGIVTSAAEPVVAWVNAALVLGLVVSVVVVFVDAPRLLALAGIVAAGLTVWISFQLLRIFPFPYGDELSGGSTMVRVVLAFAMIGGIVWLIVSIGRFLRG